MTNEQGGVIDDILVYRQPFAYLVVCNASNRGQGRPAVRAPSRRTRRARFAIGPRHGDDRRPGSAGARDAPAAVRPAAGVGPLLSPDDGTAPGPDRHGDQPDGIHGRGRLRGDRRRRGRPWRSGRPCWNRASRTGSSRAAWVHATRSGSRPRCRCTATSSPRTIDPYSAGLGWAVKLDKGDFVGREALMLRKAAPAPGADRPGPRRQADRPPGCDRAVGRAGGRPGHVGDVLADPAAEHRHGAWSTRGSPADRHRRCRSTCADTANPPASSSSPSTSGRPQPRRWPATRLPA